MLGRSGYHRALDMGLTTLGASVWLTRGSRGGRASPSRLRRDAIRAHRYVTSRRDRDSMLDLFTSLRQMEMLCGPTLESLPKVKSWSSDSVLTPGADETASSILTPTATPSCNSFPHLSTSGPRDRLWDALYKMRATSRAEKCFYWRDSMKSTPGEQHSNRRSLFPLPYVSAPHADPVAEWTNLYVCALNFLNSGADSRAGASVCSSRPSVAQSSALELVQTKVRRMWERFGEISDEKNLPVSASDAASNFEMDSNTHYPAFDPDAVDLPEKAAVVESMNAVPETIRPEIVSPEELFPRGMPGSRGLPKCIRGNSKQYARLVGRSLLCGKVVLSDFSHSVASVFVIGKKGSTRLREIWAGNGLSEVALKPRKPRKPPLLGNPAVFQHIIKPKHCPLYMSKRDAKAFFDLLYLPRELRPYFGRPRVSLKHLCSAMRWKRADLIKYFEKYSPGLEQQHTADVLCASWPMGFSHSSNVAQCNIVNVCMTAGLSRDRLMSLDQALPESHNELATAVTDDVLFFHTSHRQGAMRLDAFDNAFKSVSIEKIAIKTSTLFSA